jgi:hypothetical protein
VTKLLQSRRLSHCCRKNGLRSRSKNDLNHRCKPNQPPPWRNALEPKPIGNFRERKLTHLILNAILRIADECAASKPIAKHHPLRLDSVSRTFPDHSLGLDYGYQIHFPHRLLRRIRTTSNSPYFLGSLASRPCLARVYPAAPEILHPHRRHRNVRR